jgi:hypothetical protein
MDIKELNKPKQYIIHSEYRGTDDIVGIIHCDENNYYKVEVLVSSDRYDFPVDLLGPHRDWGEESQPEIIRWLESRVVPRNRQFLRQMLDAYNIPEWDLDTLLKLNHGRVCDDKFYVEIKHETV